MKLPALREIVEERKGKAIENLSVSFAKNRLPLEEYERLVEYINKIESERELLVVEKIVAEYDVKEKHPDNESRDERDYRPNQYFSPGNLTLLSTRTVSGPLKSGTQFVSVLGSMEIKIRKDDLQKQRTVLNVFSILGNNEIMVEPGIQVTNNTIPILGSSSVDRKVKREARSDEPELVITGTAILGNASVKLLKE